ncbi:MAG: glycosyltransferase [Reyranella sp.]|uniref:glycosyltransferase family 2 protein n=1 Tax=Reyranella sp. TaxID=1929291 RepID=UPI00122BC916|nr:glycosyltransferase family 2 protein [Reyranella sp.]TAJ85257.1 MAG: glycosyltransferase [Reyranella sp.]TBR22603.1 MAG: glycosyltransferase [Reyranella sp.]
MVERSTSLKTVDSCQTVANNVQLEMVFAGNVPAGQWMRLRYQTSLYCSAGRLAIRFGADGGEVQAALPAAFFGAGEWLGLVPQGTRRVNIILSDGCAATDFHLASCEVLSFREVVSLARGRSAGKTLLAAGLGAVGLRGDASGILQDVLGATPLERYHEWRALNGRDLDLAGLEAQRDSWRQGPHIRVIVHTIDEKSAEALDTTFASLQRQTYPNWSLTLVGAEMTHRGDRQAFRVEADARAGLLWEGLEASDIVLPVVAGDVVADYAMAALVEFAAGRPDCSMFYADEDSIDARRRHVAPELKPDWSPIFHEARPYVGRAVYFRRRALEAHADRPLAALLRPSAWNALFAAEAGPVGHIRRLLLTKPWKPAETGTPVIVARPTMERATATLIVPTRDRADLLAACLAGLEKTEPRNFDLVIVDNGSKEPATHDLFERVRMHSWARVVDVAGPFNFSALCNRAAELAEGQVLVFLNNDTAAMQPDWLATLVSWAVRPDVGAVGPKLVYPSGRLQHAGLVLGLGGYAAHIDNGAGPEHRGYLDRFTVPHEVSAVTGACLAVEKGKFDAIGGFDAKRYPIELGDVDLCLRLRQRGWKTVFTPYAVLKHHESATRGRSNVAKRYAKERRHFLESWKDAVLDDPFFHPALSLTARRTRLDH